MSSAIKTPAFQAKAGNIQNEDGSSIYSGGEWSFKNASAVTGFHIASDGNVGIGTTSPGVALNSVGSATFGSNPNGIALFQASKITTSDAGVLFGSENGNLPYIAATKLNNGTGSATDLAFRTNSAERMRIDASGNLLVGTTASQAKIVLKQSIDGFGGGLQYIRSAADRRWEFVTGGDDKLYIGYGAGVTPSAVGNFATNGVYTPTSDIRKKRDLDYSFNGLDLLNGIKPALGRMLTDSDESPLRPFFIAQDVVKTLPSLVSSLDPNPEAKDPIMGVDYASFTPVLVKAIQELSAKNEALEARLAALESK